MSALLTGMVLERFPATEQAELTVALVLADHANHDGKNIYPAMPRIGALARVSERHARRIMGVLCDLGYIIQETPGGGRGNPARYRIDVAWLASQPSVLPGGEKGDVRSGFPETLSQTPNPDTVSGFPAETRTKPGHNPDTAVSGDPRTITDKDKKYLLPTTTTTTRAREGGGGGGGRGATPEELDQFRRMLEDQANNLEKLYPEKWVRNALRRLQVSANEDDFEELRAWQEDQAETAKFYSRQRAGRAGVQQP